MSPSLRLTTPLVLLGVALTSWLLANTLDPAQQAEPLSVDPSSGGSLENKEGLPVVRLTGSPYDLGYQQGTLLREKIRARIQNEVYGGLVGGRGISHLLLLRRARQIDTLLTEEYRQELRGLADGAGISYLQVLVLNTVDGLIEEDVAADSVRQLILSLSPTFVPRFSATESTRGFQAPNALLPEEQAASMQIRAAFAGFGSATTDGSLVQAAWFASPAPELGDLVVVVCQPQSGNTYLGLGKPGSIGVFAGLNEEGLVVTRLKSPSQDASLAGISAAMLLRQVLQHGGGLPTAVRIMTSAQRSGGQNVLIGDVKRPDAQVVEFSAHDFAVFPAENGLVVRTRHYLDTELGRTQYSLSSWNGDESWEDLDSLLRALENAYGSLDSDKAAALVAELPEAEEQVSVAEGQVRGIVLDGRTHEITLVTGREGAPSPVVGLDEAR